jgi:AbiV family abortive infection protein
MRNYHQETQALAGMAFLAFEGQGRNLADSSVAYKLKRAMEDHSQKITSAFTAWLVATPNVRESVIPAIHLMLNLKHGREPSMYTDISSDSSTIQIPATVIREKASFECIRLATDCLSHTQVHISEKTPEPRTRAEDQMFAMKAGQFQKIASTEDFWWYYIAQSEEGQKDFAEAVMSYQENYAKQGLIFQKSNKDVK